MGTSDTWPDDGSPAGGVGTITRPGTGPAADPAAEPGVRRGQQRPAAPPRVPPQRTGRPGRRRPRPAGQPGQPGHVGQPGQPGRSAQSLAPDTATRRAADGMPRTAAPRTPLRGQRMPFFLVLCGLLGGALISALVISTTLAEGSYQITRLQQANGALARQRQMLQDQVAAAQSAEVIEQRALELGMRPAGELRFLNLKNGKIETDAGSGQVRDIHVPGYTP